MKKPKKTIDSIYKEMQVLSNQLYMECYKCEGKGEILVQVGKDPKGCKECNGTGRLSRIERMERDIRNMKKDISKIKLDLTAHINRQTAEINVIEEDGRWGDYTGIFFVDSTDEREIVLDKAKKHFKTYFKNSMYHRNKSLGIFLNSGRSGKHLVEEIQTD